MLSVESELTDTTEMMKTESDAEMVAMVKDEVDELALRLASLRTDVAAAHMDYGAMMLTADEEDDDFGSPDSLMMEVRAGSGGEEAGLFAAELLRMYEIYCHGRRWTFQISDTATRDGTSGDSLKEALVLVDGKGCFARLRQESGTHRVQRVPVTDAKGRIQTSTVTIAVLPQAPAGPGHAKHIEIPASDLQVDTMKASGAGGQHVNTTDSAVRLTHLPTGIIVASQSQRSQHQNKDFALKVLRAKIADLERAKIEAERSELRAATVGTGDRSEKIRTSTRRRPRRRGGGGGE
jgi:peptide chain release factor 1